MARRTIPQRELRNQVARVLREAEAGDEIVVTVRGRPVAQLGPVADAPARQRNVPGELLKQLLAATPVDPGFAEDVAANRAAETTPRLPWDE